MIVNGRIVYSTAGWIHAQHPGSAHTHGGNWAATCCAATAEETSGHFEYRPNARRES